MKRFATLSVLATIAALSAFADTLTLPPGLWSYEGRAQLGLAELNDSGRECLRPGASTYDLSKVAQSITPGCELVGATYTGDGVVFSVACTGDVKGELEGQFSFTDRTASLEAQGWTGQPDAPLSLTVRATAERIGESC